MKSAVLHCLFLVCLQILSTQAMAMELPLTYDLRNIDGRSYIGPIRDQGHCGSCYSFGALAAAESTWNRAHELYGEQAIDLSEAFMVWSLSPLYAGMNGCEGGNIFDPMNALVEIGVPLEVDFPYTVNDPGADLRWEANRYSLLDWYHIPTNDIETTKRVLYAIGAVKVSVFADDDFMYHEGGIFENDYTGITDAVPYYSRSNHAVSLVGWDDEPGDDGLGNWILRNSWGTVWLNDGYMDIRYTSAGANLKASYFIATPWSGPSVTVNNKDEVTAEPWSVGGTRNAHGVDLWGGAASSVINQGLIHARADSAEELVTARGIYLWGGPEGQIVNNGTIVAQADSENNQAIAYGVCLQGGRVENSGSLDALAISQGDHALAFGVWAANGGNLLEIRNGGEIRAWAQDADQSIAYGLWADSRVQTKLLNSGTIIASAGTYAAGVLLTGGPVWLENSGTIQASGIGVMTTDPQAVIINRGLIGGDIASIYAYDNALLLLDTGSKLNGQAVLMGNQDLVALTGNGQEDSLFIGAENLIMLGDDWSLAADSTFERILIAAGRLGVDGALSGETTIMENGTLGGNGSLSGTVTNYGRLAPGHSIGHLRINGDFIQTADGALVLEVGDGTADALTISGNAELAGTLLVMPWGYAGDGRYTFLQAEALRGEFDALSSVAVLSVALDGSLANSLSLEVLRNPYVDLVTAHNLGLATHLDGVRAVAGGDFASLLNTLDLAMTQSALNEAMGDLTPRIHGLASAAALADAQGRLADVRRHLDGLDPATLLAQKPNGRAAVWFDLLGQDSRYGRDGGYFDARQKLYGLLLGVEHTNPEGLTLGGAAAVTESRLRERGGDDQSKNDSQQGFLYARWSDPHKAAGPYLSAVVGGGRVGWRNQRHIAFADRRADSRHDGVLYGATLSGGYGVALNGWRLTPSLGLSFVHMHEENFRERGADSANLQVASRSNDSLQSLLGVRFARPLVLPRILLNPELRLEWRHEFDRKNADLQARLDGGDGFASPGRDLPGDALLMGAGLGVRLSQSLSGGVDYVCDLQNQGASSHSLRLHMAWTF